MTLPSAETISEFAREVVRSHAQDIESMSVGEMMSGDPRFDEVTEEEFDDLQDAIYDQARTYAETLTWSQEQDADVQAVAALLAAQADGASMAECKHAFASLRDRFADRIAALDGEVAP